jgi:sigma-B regulation protein RsbU (phosphoserine phosphatase)
MAYGAQVMSASDFRDFDSARVGGAVPANGRAGVRRRLQGAAEVQRALLPAPCYSGSLAEAAAMTRPRWAVGGDFYDYIDRGREFRVVLGDACGKGTAAALQAAVVQGLLAIEAEECGGPARLMADLNRALCRRLIPARFVTLFYGILGPEHRLTYCNAGLCRPLVVNQDRVHRLATGGPPLGLFSDATFEESTLTLYTGDILAACSDGILEALGSNGSSGEEFGDRRVLDVVWRHRDKSPNEIVDSLVTAVRTFTGGGSLHDDMTALVVRYLG